MRVLPPILLLTSHDSQLGRVGVRGRTGERGREEESGVRGRRRGGEEGRSKSERVAQGRIREGEGVV